MDKVTMIFVINFQTVIWYHVHTKAKTESHSAWVPHEDLDPCLWGTLICLRFLLIAWVIRDKLSRCMTRLTRCTCTYSPISPIRVVPMITYAPTVQLKNTIIKLLLIWHFCHLYCETPITSTHLNCTEIKFSPILVTLSKNKCCKQHKISRPTISSSINDVC